MNFYFILGLAVLCFLCSCMQNSSPAEEYRLIKVIDGDTIYIKSAEGKRFILRYIGINCPEKNEPFYHAATRENIKLLKRRKLRLEFDCELQDQYGRLLAYVFVDGTMVNAELLRLGLARSYDDHFNQRYKSLFIRMEEQARLNQRGLWGKNTY